MPDKIGFIGLGIMGRPMALNLRKAGLELFVHARRAELMEPLAAVGALPCTGPDEVARRSDVIITMVSDTADVEQVVLGPGGLIEGVRPGSVLVDMSTISASATRRMADRLRAMGVEMLDAPVSGGEQGAVQGILSIMAGGSEPAYARVRPLFEIMGANLVHVGGNGAGQICKACNQVVVSHTLAGVGEAILLAEASGVDPVKVRAALLGGSANSKILEIHGRRMIEGDFAPGFKASLHSKDMRIVMDTARELGLALPGAALFAQYLNALVGRGLGDLDSAAVHRVQRDTCGIEPGED